MYGMTTKKPKTISSKDILAKYAKTKSYDDRKKVSLYLSTELYDAFKKKCDAANAPSSRVMEDLMKSFLES